MPGVDDPEPDPSRPGRLQGCPDHQRRLLGPLDPHHHRRVRGRLLPSRGHDHDRGVGTRRHAVGGRQGRHMPMGPALQEDHTGLRAQSDQGGHHRFVGQLGGHGDVAARALSHRPGRGLQQLGRLAPQGRLERVPGLSPLGSDRGTDRVHEVHPGATPSRLRHRGRQHRAGLAVRHADQDPRALSSRHHNSSGQGTRPRTAFRSFHCRSTGRRWTGTMCPRSLGRWALPGASGTTHSAVIASQDVDPAGAPGRTDGGEHAHDGGDDEVDREGQRRHRDRGDALVGQGAAQRDAGRPCRGRSRSTAPSSDISTDSRRTTARTWRRVAADRPQQPELAGALDDRQHQRVDDAEDGHDHRQQQQRGDDAEQLVDGVLGLLA